MTGTAAVRSTSTSSSGVEKDTGWAWMTVLGMLLGSPPAYKSQSHADSKMTNGVNKVYSCLADNSEQMNRFRTLQSLADCMA